MSSSGHLASPSSILGVKVLNSRIVSIFKLKFHVHINVPLMGIKAACFPTAMAKLKLMPLWMFGSKQKKKGKWVLVIKYILVDVKYVIANNAKF